MRAVAADDAGELALAGGFGEFVDEQGAGGVADPAALLAGGHAEPDQEVGFAGAGVAEQHDRVSGVDPGAGGEGGELGGADGRDGAGVEAGEPLEARELRLGDAAGAAAGGSVAEFGGQDLGEAGQVGASSAGGDLGEPGGFGADGGQAQLASGRADGGLGGGVGGCSAARAPAVRSGVNGSASTGRTGARRDLRRPGSCHRTRRACLLLASAPSRPAT